MTILKLIKKSLFGETLKWILRAFRSWRAFFRQLFFSYKYYHTKRLAICCDIKCTIKYAGNKKAKFPHPVGVVIGMGVILGSECVIFQNSTLGTKKMEFGDDYPKLGNNVIVGANAVVIGDITIGNNVTIGALTLVNGDVPDNAIVIGNPMKIVGYKTQTN